MLAGPDPDLDCVYLKRTHVERDAKVESLTERRALVDEVIRDVWLNIDVVRVYSRVLRLAVFDRSVQQVTHVDRFGRVYVQDLEPSQHAAVLVLVDLVLTVDENLASIETNNTIIAPGEVFRGNACRPDHGGRDGAPPPKGGGCVDFERPGATLPRRIAGLV